MKKNIMPMKTHLMLLALATTLAMPIAVFAQQETTPPPAGSVFRHLPQMAQTPPRQLRPHVQERNEGAKKDPKSPGEGR